ncbi:MAG: hypothetical protein BWY25_02720 [Chloroflexi bacterium ADurb.Bin222]|nr:MAG: hypothetical protein BWY25_02720 [Chloroflexi bacterium ADurb.Bin222]
MEPAGFLIYVESGGIVEQAFDGFGRPGPGAAAAEKGLRDLILGVYFLGALQIPASTFLSAVLQQRSQKQVGFQAIRKDVQDSLALLSRQHDLIIAPVGFGEGHLQVHPVGVFGDERAEFFNGAVEQAAAQVESRQACPAHGDVVRRDAAVLAHEAAELIMDGFIARSQVKGLLQIPDRRLQLPMTLMSEPQADAGQEMLGVGVEHPAKHVHGEVGQSCFEQHFSQQVVGAQVARILAQNVSKVGQRFQIPRLFDHLVNFILIGL